MFAALDGRNRVSLSGHCFVIGVLLLFIDTALSILHLGLWSLTIGQCSHQYAIL